MTIPQSTVSELENGQRRLDVAELLLLAGLYGRSPAWFLDLSPNGAAPPLAERLAPEPSDD